MAEALVARYWCHMCSQMVNPVMEVEIKCPFCESGFVEEMDSSRGDDDRDMGSDRTLSLWAPILLGMIGGARRRRFRREDDDMLGESEQDRTSRDPEQIIRRRRRSSAAILQLLQGLRSSELEVPESERDRERVILINPFNQALVLQGSFDTNDAQNQNQSPPGSMGDYFVGPGLELLLQHLAENDPSRYGTPPAKKEAIEAMPTLKIKENLRCSVCLDDFDIGSDAKEMPCSHKFHVDCIMPWLELHSSCPVCRFQLPPVGSKVDYSGSGNYDRTESDGGEERANEGGNESERNFWIPVPWPFNGPFSMSGSQAGGNSSSSASGSDSLADEN